MYNYITYSSSFVTYTTNNYYALVIFTTCFISPLAKHEEFLNHFQKRNVTVLSEIVK